MEKAELSKVSAPCRLTGARTVWRDRDGEPLVAPLGGHFRRTVTGELVELPPYYGPIREGLRRFLPKDETPPAVVSLPWSRPKAKPAKPKRR